MKFNPVLCFGLVAGLADQISPPRVSSGSLQNFRLTLANPCEYGINKMFVHADPSSLVKGKGVDGQEFTDTRDPIQARFTQHGPGTITAEFSYDFPMRSLLVDSVMRFQVRGLCLRGSSFQLDPLKVAVDADKKHLLERRSATKCVNSPKITVAIDYKPCVKAPKITVAVDYKPCVKTPKITVAVDYKKPCVKTPKFTVAVDYKPCVKAPKITVAVNYKPCVKAPKITVAVDYKKPCIKTPKIMVAVDYKKPCIKTPKIMVAVDYKPCAKAPKITVAVNYKPCITSPKITVAVDYIKPCVNTPAITVAIDSQAPENLPPPSNPDQTEDENSAQAQTSITPTESKEHSIWVYVGIGGVFLVNIIIIGIILKFCIN